MQKHYNAIADAVIAAIQDKEMSRLDLLRLFLQLYKSLETIVNTLADISFRDDDSDFRNDLDIHIRRDN